MTSRPCFAVNLDADAVDMRRECALLGFEERLVRLVAAADVEVEHALLFGDVEQDREETLPPFLKKDGNPVAALDHAAQLEDHFARAA
ncbi:MAG: hypothetical protein QM739_02225 [Propionivibrio sp.]